MHEGMPVPSAEHEKLSQLLGRWEGEEKLSPSPWGPGGPAFGRYTMTSVCDGFWVAQDYVEEKDGKVTFRGHGVFGYDPKSGEHIWYWVDSMGSVPVAPSRGKWEGNLLVLESKSPMGTGRYTYRFDAPDRLFFKIENCFDGQTFVQFMEGTYRRVG